MKDLHPDRYGNPIGNDVTTYGRNRNDGTYPESAYIRCLKCGWTMNTVRHPNGWGSGNTNVYTQLNGAVTASATTITVDSTTGFKTPKTGSITAFASVYGGKWAKVTDSAHGLKGGKVIISSTTNYNGTFYIQDVLTDSFVICKAYVADDATGTWIQPEDINIYDVGTYSTSGDVSSTYTAATGGPRCDRVQYTGLTSTTFTGCTGVLAHDDNMYVRRDPDVTSGCPLCGTFNYD